MKTTLVNHSGIVQDKFVLRNMDDVRAYHKISSSQFTGHVLDRSEKQNPIRDAIKEVAEMTGESILMTSFKMADEKIMTIQKEIQSGHIIVVNLSGGYTFWDDESMSIVSETERQPNGSQYLPKVDIGHNEVLVLENQEEIPIHIPFFIKEHLHQKTFSSVVRLNTDYNNEIAKWILLAMERGCNTIVAETQLMDRKQLLKFYELFERLPPFTFYIFTQTDLRGLLTELIGEEKTNSLFSRHTIIIR